MAHNENHSSGRKFPTFGCFQSDFSNALDKFSVQQKHLELNDIPKLDKL
jgi:hypothetical protein